MGKPNMHYAFFCVATRNPLRRRGTFAELGGPNSTETLPIFFHHPATLRLKDPGLAISHMDINVVIHLT